MLKIALTIAGFLLSFTAHAHWNNAQLIERCHGMIGQLNQLETAQHKALCRAKLASAAYKVDLSATKIHLKRYKDASHHVSYAIEDLAFAIKIDCILKHDILKIKKEAHAVKDEIGRLYN